MREKCLIFQLGYFTYPYRLDFVGVAPLKEHDEPFFVPKSDEPVTHTFHLPLGFDGFGVREDDSLDYGAVKGLFFSLYRGFNRFVKDQPKRAAARSKSQQDFEDQRRQEGGLGSSVTSADSAARYSGLTEITEVLLALPELNITRLERPQAPVDQVDYGQIHKYLDQCIYMEDHCAYIDWMNLPRRELRSGYSDLLGMYCFILDSILVELNDDVTLPGPESALLESLVIARRPEIARVADQFRERHLSAASDLFSEEGSEHVTLILEELLAEIDQVTAFRDRDFHTLFEACERFLYGALDSNVEGSSWGLDKFSLFWEDLCHTWFFSQPNTEVLYADCDLPKAPHLISALSGGEAIRERIGNLRLGKSDHPDKSGWVYVGDKRYDSHHLSREGHYRDSLKWNTNHSQAKVKSTPLSHDIQELLCVSYRSQSGYFVDKGLISKCNGENTHRSLIKRLLRPDLINVYDDQHVATSQPNKRWQKKTSRLHQLRLF